MLYLAGRAFAFGGIKHPDLTPFLRWGPVIVASVVTLLFWLLPVQPKLAGDGSLSRHMITIFAILPGFFIAAIAAVATFNRAEMDEIMPEPAPELKLRTGLDESYVKLTSRMFTSHLFAYLTTLSFCAVFLFIIVDLTAPSAGLLIGKIPEASTRNVVTVALSLVYVWIVAWFAAKIVLTTLIGLYFLAERIHRPQA
jgi:hypothetical protein